MEALVKDLISEFIDENGNRFCKSVYRRYYAYLADSFSEVVEECCKVTIFGREYSLSPRELYNYDRCLAVEAWGSHLDDQFGNFRDSVSWFFSDELDEFTEAFQQWLASQDDEQASDVIVAIMTESIDLEDAVCEWLYDRLSNEDWDYPA